MAKNKRVRITNERLNSYGTRVLTAGMDVEDPASFAEQVAELF